jgi:V/A-type H+-transporting ATPase subunit E
MPLVRTEDKRYNRRHIFKHIWSLDMSEELQSLIEKINRDGVEKATAEAERIVSSAKEQATAILKSAKEEAARYAVAAEADAKASAERAQETLRQVARDAVISVEGSVTRLLEKILASNVDAALSDPAVAATIAGEAVRDVVTSGEISATPKIAEAIKAQLAAKANFTVIMDETHGSGFTVKLDGGRVEHDFTGVTVAAELAKRLRPDLAALMKDVQSAG